MSDEGRARVGRAEWAKRVERWRDSGLSAAEFGAEIGVNPRTLTYWKWMLKQEKQPRCPRAWTTHGSCGLFDDGRVAT